MQKRRWWSGSWLVALGVAGCGGAATEPGTSSLSGSLVATPPADAGAPVSATEPREVGLSASGSCDTLLAALQADLFARTRRRADQARQSPYNFTPDANTGAAFADPVPGGVSSDTPLPIPMAADAAAGSENARSAELEAADIIKAEGNHLYVLDNASEAQRLVIMEAAPAQALGVLGSVPIEGTGIELVSRGRRVLVFSRIAGALPGADESFPEYEPVFTKLTLVDGSAAPPLVERELYVEGEYVLARQQGGLVRAVFQHFPKLRLDAPVLSDTDILGRTRPPSQIDAQVDAWVEITDASISSSTLGAYLPGVYERQDGALVARAPSCNDSFVPPAGRADPGATSVFSLDLDALDAPSATSDAGAGAGELPLSSFTVFGYAQGVALDAGAAVLRQTRVILPTDEAPQRESDLHVFELAGLGARYTASGNVAGAVTVLDRRAAVLRAIASEGVYVATEGGLRFNGNALRALTLALENERLVELGSVAIPDANESVNAARFVDSAAYLLTTHVEGPGFGPASTALVAVDLSDPRAPRETGRLPVAASSSVLLPLSDERLLSVAHAPDPDEIREHAELLLFDVGELGAPSLAARHAYGPASSAASDPRAVAFSADRSRFGLPVTSGASGSSFDVFELSASGLVPLGQSVPASPELTLVQCLELRSQATDPDSIAAIESDPALLAATLQQCNATRPRPFVYRGLLRARDAIVLSRSAFPLFRWTLAAHALDALDAAPLSQVDF